MRLKQHECENRQQPTGGLAQRRLTLPFMRATTFQFRTAFSAGLLPPLRQTAS